MYDFIINDGVLVKCKNNVINVLFSNEVKVIGEESFADINQLKSIQFAEGLTKINKKAFLNCTSLKTVLFPESLTVIEDDAFENCTNLDDISKQRITSLNPQAIS